MLANAILVILALSLMWPLALIAICHYYCLGQLIRASQRFRAEDFNGFMAAANVALNKNPNFDPGPNHTQWMWAMPTEVDGMEQTQNMRIR